MTNVNHENMQKGKRKNVVDLFHKIQAPMAAAQVRQRERLAIRAKEVEELLDNIDLALRGDLDSAINRLVEATRQLEEVAEDVAIIREHEDTFGRGSKDVRLAKLAEKMEKGVAYLLGMFSVATTSKNLSSYNWKLIERDVQEVLGTSRAIGDEIHGEELALAA